MSAYSQHTIDSCRVVGFAGIGNPQRDITPVQLTSSSYYSPVKYPGILTEHSASEARCQEMTKTFTIAFGVVIFVVQFLQVNT
jgi:hypothetical protein